MITTVDAAELKRELDAMLGALEEVRAAIERALADLDYVEGLDSTAGDLEAAVQQVEEIMGRIGAVIRELEG